MKATLQFETGKIPYGRGKPLWTLTKEFKDQKHMDNFIAYIHRTKGYYLDEVFLEEDNQIKSE
jgi:hypothetical protein